MATVTPNIGLTLPAGNEKVSRQTINDNMTIIDTAFGNAHDSSVDSMQAGLSNVVDGDTTDEAIPAGAYAYIKNNEHSLAEGYYQNTSGSAFPASGGTADSTVFTPVSTAGILNSLNNKLNYSTSEILVGEFLGDNLYRKVFVFHNVVFPKDSQVILSNSPGISASKAVYIRGFLYTSTDYCLADGQYLYTYIDGFGNLRMAQSFSSSITGTNIYVTIEYLH